MCHVLLGCNAGASSEPGLLVTLVYQYSLAIQSTILMTSVHKYRDTRTYNLSTYPHIVATRRGLLPLCCVMAPPEQNLSSGSCPLCPRPPGTFQGQESEGQVPGHSSGERKSHSAVGRRCVREHFSSCGHRSTQNSRSLQENSHLLLTGPLWPPSCRPGLGGLKYLFQVLRDHPVHLLK